jgi:3-oxoacyl-[acyl-carrier-protein] synthase II
VSKGGAQIVVTGVGLATCLGLTARETWEGVLTNRCGLGTMPALEQPIPSGHTGAQAADLPADYLPGAVREVRYLRWVVEAALREAGPGPFRPERTGVVLGTTLHGIRQGGVFLRTGSHEPLDQFLGGALLREALAGLPICGPALTTCSACSSGLAAIALGMTLLRTGKLDRVIAGGYDPVSEYVYAGFHSLRLVAGGDLRPFCRGRDGMKLGEGYAVVVLERASDAAARGAEPLGTLLGFGESADAHHLTQPHPEGEGAARAAMAALRMAGLGPERVGLCSAHATGTPNNDAAEWAAMQRVLCERASQTPVVAFKSHVGHTLGAAGATELILSLHALREQVVPPTAGADPASLEFPVRVEPAKRETDIAATMNMSLGFGGANTCMIAARGGASPKTGPQVRGERLYLRPVLITGVGVVVAGAVGNEALTARLTGQRLPISADAGGLADEAMAHLLNARRVRRMSEYEKITLAATAEAFRDAGVEDIGAFSAESGAILGSLLGSTSFSEPYYRQIVNEGIAAANPMLFAEGVPNAAAAQLSMVFGVKGGCQTVIGTRTSGLEALWLAALRIGAGEWERAIVSAGEEYHEVINGVWRAWGFKAGPGFVGSARAPRGFFTGSGAATIVLESEASAAARGARVRARLDAAAGGAGVGLGVRSMTDACTRLVESLGAVDGVAVSSSGTWMDRVERAGLRRAGFTGAVGSIEGYLPELFSAGPLAAIAGVVLTGRVPAPLFERDGGSAQVRSVGVLCTDFAGACAAVRVALGEHS